MSKLLIGQYLNELSRLKQVSGTSRESVVREAFKDLLKGYARSHDLVFVPEFEIESPTKERRYVDGALLHALRLPFGYWEAKDEKDDLDAEIAHKFKRGYPRDNIIFDDSTQVVLIQNGIEVIRCQVEDTDSLQKLLALFFGYERPEIAEFRKAVEQFTADLPEVLKSLRSMIDAAHDGNAAFRKAAQEFLDHARKTINPSLTDEDVREILIQHILTDEIFDEVFPGQPFHKDNNVARELHKLEDTFFTGNVKFQTLKGLEVYYRAIRSAAARISSHHEKQTFLKTVYENFYKVYNPKAADRLGVVYTPGEIVRFMIESADWLCETHFKRSLIDKDVEILDPAVGTGTFVTELIEHFRGQPTKLKHKYKEELHANEVGILPYYVANLNIEATYAAITGEYEEFPGLCLVDTLDNVAGLGKKTGDHVADLFGMGDENVERIKRQNRRKISVVIGNPPYNANQLNENDNNKNREYPEIDRRIKDSYIKASTAQKTKLYDMYARFVRWASDRVHDDGIVAFVSNNSFVEARTFDGFRACLAKEFNEIWIIDLKGNARTSGERRRQEGGNIFDDQIRVGVAIWFCVKKRDASGCRIRYESVRDYAKAEEKRHFLQKPLRERPMQEIKPDHKHNWLNLTINDFEELIPLASKGAKQGKRGDKAIFRLFGNGINTARDEWVTDLDSIALRKKVTFFLDEFEKIDPKSSSYGGPLKWSRNLKNKLARGMASSFEKDALRLYDYRPYFRVNGYLSSLMIDELGQFQAFDVDGNRTINFPSGKDFRCLASDKPTDFHYIGDTKVIGRWRKDENGSRTDNITDWALKQFKDHYGAKGKQAQPITKDAIFHYVYAVLHDPLYREKYALNLRRDFPRIPLHGDSAATFWQWAQWGEQLMTLHIDYESVAPWPLTRKDVPDEKARNAGQSPKLSLKADKATGRILLDSETTLSGIPSSAWDYTLGNRSALEWVLEQYKESKPRDQTIREKFDEYRFANYKEKVIDLLMRLTRVSVETQEIVKGMREKG